MSHTCMRRERSSCCFRRCVCNHSKRSMPDSSPGAVMYLGASSTGGAFGSTGRRSSKIRGSAWSLMFKPLPPSHTKQATLGRISKGKQPHRMPCNIQTELDAPLAARLCPATQAKAKRARTSIAPNSSGVIVRFELMVCGYEFSVMICSQRFQCSALLDCLLLFRALCCIATCAGCRFSAFEVVPAPCGRRSAVQKIRAHTGCFRRSRVSVWRQVSRAIGC
jgi:hypothetical protein